MSRVAIVVALAGCTSTQSARVLAPGKTQLAVGVARVTISEDDDGVLYTGQLRVAHGVSETAEIAAEVGRTPGAGETYTSFAVAPKFQISRSPTSAVSLAIPVSLAWGERGLDDVGGGTFAVLPTLYAGFDLSKDAELVIAPSLGVGKTVDEPGALYALGLSLGIRMGDASTLSGFQPSLGFLRLSSSEGRDSITFLMLGLGVAVGD